ncbi:MAG: hypothetical protein H6867_06010 [Rhodospirillales bacterium]|nr:hypothetical protein [Rhodospirillales bacterium]MCB9995083.1 hypothetical protein [Rhodospirillales bacterium]
MEKDIRHIVVDDFIRYQIEEAKKYIALTGKPLFAEKLTGAFNKFASDILFQREITQDLIDDFVSSIDDKQVAHHVDLHLRQAFKEAMDSIANTEIADLEDIYSNGMARHYMPELFRPYTK